jgi:hypothetical protein
MTTAKKRKVTDEYLKNSGQRTTTSPVTIVSPFAKKARHFSRSAI